ncbi:MAG TPA: hypothetical protein VF071_07210 [Candidatus Limnocylindria bacterium]
MTNPPAGSWVRDARDLYLAAMAVFVVNIVIGILNGADAVEFNRDQVLTHVHAGTVGWLTLAIVASAFMLFRESDRRLMLTLAVLVPVYVLAFYTGNLAFRAISGAALLLAVAWLLIWLWRLFLASERTLPRLALLLALTTFGYGAVVGVLLQLQYALEIQLVSGDGVGAHASAMTFGYLVMAAMGFIEWRLLGTRGLPTLGVIQVVALFLGGLVISVGLLAGLEQAAGGIYLLTQLVAVILFVIRIWPASLRVSWFGTDAGRHFGAASIWVVGALVLFMYLVFSFITAENPDDPAAFPLNVLIASDHVTYIGVITNIAVALLAALVLARGGTAAWVRHSMFWGINLGLAVFVLGLLVDTAELKRIGAPVMGVALLAALGILAWAAVRSEPQEPAEIATP